MVRNFKPKTSIITGSKVTDAQVREVLLSYQRNEPISFIAKQARLSRPTVYRVVSRYQDKLSSDPFIVMHMVEGMVSQLHLDKVRHSLAVFVWRDIIAPMFTAWKRDQSREKLVRCVKSCPDARYDSNDVARRMLALNERHAIRPISSAKKRMGRGSKWVTRLQLCDGCYFRHCPTTETLFKNVDVIDIQLPQLLTIMEAFASQSPPRLFERHFWPAVLFAVTITTHDNYYAAYKARSNTVDGEQYGDELLTLFRGALESAHLHSL